MKLGSTSLFALNFHRFDVVSARPDENPLHAVGGDDPPDLVIEHLIVRHIWIQYSPYSTAEKLKFKCIISVLSHLLTMEI